MTQIRFSHVLAVALVLPVLAIVSIAPEAAENDVSAAASDGNCWDAGEVVVFHKFSLPELERCIVAGSDPNIRAQYGFPLLTITISAISEPWHEYVDFIRLLLEAGADPNVSDDYEFTTPLHGISWGGRMDKEAERADAEIARLLLEAGADPNARDKWDYTPLHAAATSGRADIVRLLLDAGADPDAQTIGGRTPLADAKMRGYTDVIQILRNAGAK